MQDLTKMGDEELVEKYERSVYELGDHGGKPSYGSTELIDHKEARVEILRRMGSKMPSPEEPITMERIRNAKNAYGAPKPDLVALCQGSPFSVRLAGPGDVACACSNAATCRVKFYGETQREDENVCDTCAGKLMVQTLAGQSRHCLQFVDLPKVTPHEAVG